MISFALLTLAFVCCSFSSCFRGKVRLFIWDFSCFMSQDCIAMNFILRTAFAASNKFWTLMLSSSFVTRCFLFFFFLLLWFLQWSNGCLLAYCLATTCLWETHLFLMLVQMGISPRWTMSLIIKVLTTFLCKVAFCRIASLELQMWQEEEGS